MHTVLERLCGMLFLDGRFVPGAGGVQAVYNPATLEVIGHSACGTPQEAHAAVQAARRAFAPWAAAAPQERAAALHRLGEGIARDAARMARALTLEQGKPLNEARGEIDKLAAACHFYAEECVRVFGSIIPGEAAGVQSLVLREPIGVVAAITPWNYPAELIGWKLCAALAAGCTIVIKPADLTPFTALMIAEKVLEAGIAPGVVNVVPGSGAVVGQALVEPPEVDKIAFTGSSATGLRIQQSCPQVKHFSLELGGNCPMIVTRHADLKAAVKGAARRAFRNAGQICIAINRIYVERPVYAAFCQKLAQAADALVVANGLEHPGADMGHWPALRACKKRSPTWKMPCKRARACSLAARHPRDKPLRAAIFFAPRCWPTAPTPCR